MKLFTVLSLIAICILFSCSKTAVNINNQGFTGSWILKQISGGIAGQTTTPDKLTTLTLQADKRYSTSYNNQPGDKGIYTITKAGQPNYYSSDTILKFFPDNNNDTLMYGVSIAKDSLVLDEGCCDRFSYTYIRQK